jgi:membrane-bound lytic murein transglycosylase F
MLIRVSFMVLSLVVLAGFESSVGSTFAQPTNPNNEAETSAVVEESTNQQSADASAEQGEQIAETAKLPQTISKFDALMKRVGEESGYDWRFMSAIAYSESRFIENLESKQGAKGIMQIRPVVARHFKMPVESINETETNIRLAGMLLSELDGMLRMPASTPEQDRLSIILASYNAGIGHIYDACRLARSEGADPNSWAVISGYLKLMSEPEYYNRDVVKYGKFNGSAQTLGYVREVMKKYNEYRNLAS